MKLKAAVGDLDRAATQRSRYTVISGVSGVAASGLGRLQRLSWLAG